MAFGIGDKCYMVVAGDVWRQQRRDGCQRKRGEKGLLVYRSVIPRRMKQY